MLGTTAAFMYDTKPPQWLIEARISRQTNSLIFQGRSAEFSPDVSTVAYYYNILPPNAMSYPKKKGILSYTATKTSEVD